MILLGMPAVMLQCSEIQVLVRYFDGIGEEALVMMNRSHLVLSNFETESFSGLMIHLTVLDTTRGSTAADFSPLT